MNAFSPLLRFCRLAALSALLGSLGSLGTGAWAHGDVTPQAVDTRTLPALGDEWLSENPYAVGTPAHEEAVLIGSSAYNQNCARCHGLQGISGGIAPDLRKLDDDCLSLADSSQKASCLTEMNEYFITTVRRGRTRDGRVYMPPFENIFGQEAMWAIRSYLDTRREQ